MNRSMEGNPEYPSRRIQVLQIWHPPMVAEFDEAIPANPPAGFHNAVWRDDKGRICLGLRKDVTAAAAPAVVVSDKPGALDTKTMPELKQLAGMKGVPYTKQTTEADLRANLRAKGVK
jgi:hypothetical protein